MSDTRELADLAEARALRNEARNLVRGEVASLRKGLAKRPIPVRVKDRAAGEVIEAIDQARDIAGEHKAVVAGTMLALAGWFLREPVGALLAGLFDRWRADRTAEAGDDAADDYDAGGDTAGDDE